ncbi:ABC transporter permease [Asticcacaulis sp. 201]|uniref:ABC transporter permease n=1 Tax=Asticcacaulis sp. 201 TaxID=3028787 RepID=UPI002915E396|nr:ABC transporter permease [Asticcacaulis sp. 201]MDV6330890.1 ABC transporter permease [Asticcacaulis sp. 201]
MSLLNILGLAVGFAAAFIVALEVRSELGFDRFIPGADQIYLLRTLYTPDAGDQISSDQSPAGMAKWPQHDSASIEAVSRLVTAEWPMRTPHIVTQQSFYWADSNFFDVVRFSAVKGDLSKALQKPDSMVLTQKMARTFFGREDVVGQTVVLSDWLKVTITAVLADFPDNTSFGNQIFISSESSYSMISILDSHPEWNWTSCLTFVRLKPGTSLSTKSLTLLASRNGVSSREHPTKFEIVPLTQLHFLPRADSPIAARGHPDTIVAMIAVAVLIVVLAVVNFSELMTLQIDERRHEMAIRKTLGAETHHIFLQILVEAGILVCLSLTLAAAGVERFLPMLDPIMRVGRSPWSEVWFLLGSLAVGFSLAMLGAIYPALALASAHPRHSRNPTPSIGGASLSRSLWTITRFSLLILLLTTSHTVYRQWRFATSDGLNHQANRVLLINTASDVPADVRLRHPLLSVRGVENATYSRRLPEQRDIWPDWIRRGDGRIIQAQRQSVDPYFFDFYDIKPLAGRTFTTISPSLTPPREVIINRAALQALGFGKPHDAIGAKINLARDTGDLSSKIIGVVDNIRLANIRDPAPPMIFDNQSAFFNRLSVKLTPGAEASALGHIREIWLQTYPRAGPMDARFYSDYVHTEYADMYQQWYVFGLLSVIGVAVSIFGLIGLSIHIYRTGRKEIAIRNALGASKADLIGLRLKPYLRPLVIANIVAGPLAWLVAFSWLGTFALHVSPAWPTFVLASASTFLIAFGTLVIHTALVEPARSSSPLRNPE